LVSGWSASKGCGISVSKCKSTAASTRATTRERAEKCYTIGTSILKTTLCGAWEINGALSVSWTGTIRIRYPLYCVENHHCGYGMDHTFVHHGIATSTALVRWNQRTTPISPKMQTGSNSTSKRHTWTKSCL
jgi:hypothetical protein